MQARHIYICDMHKNVIQSLRSKRKRKDSEDADSGETDSEHPEVDLYQLQVYDYASNTTFSCYLYQNLLTSKAFHFRTS